MSDTITWAVLSDGRYIRILVNKGTGTKLETLKSGELEAYANLCYQLVNGKPMVPDAVAVEPEKRNEVQLQTDFLSEQKRQNMFDQLVLAAPQEVLQALRNAMPETLSQLIVGELSEDLLAQSNDVIEKRLADLI